MLPSAPKTLGRLSDVFISALGAITGKSNRLGFGKSDKVCVVLVDGLGSENLRAAGGHAPFLNAALKASKSINTVFPSTTASAITSFGVGAAPAAHGVLGYSVFDREANAVRNLLTGWDEEFRPGDFQTLKSVSELAAGSGVQSYTVGPGEYAESGFTKLNMSGAKYVAAKSFDERVEATRSILASKDSSLTYLYFPELDSIAHSHGAASTEWLNKLEDLDSSIKLLASALPKDSGLVVTADHGIVDVPKSKQIMLDELDLPGLMSVTGDPRNTFLYFQRGTAIQEIQMRLADELSGRVFVATVEDLKSNGWLSSAVTNSEFLPDLYLISTGAYACYHRAHCKPQSLRMVGQHGSISQAELSVPLLRFGTVKN
jgi:predicted AlkP superfamily pyrophosphatase or phosphodiesterase